MLNLGRRSLGCALLLLTSASAYAQTPAPAPPHKLGPGDDLPKITLPHFGSLTAESDAAGVTHITATGGVTLIYGALRIDADRITYTQYGLLIEATGHVSIIRGDESLRGDHFTFLGKEGAADAERTVIISPPFYVSADRFTQGDDGGFLKNAYVALSPDGKGEVSLSAREIQLTADGKRAFLRDATLRLFGTRILTVRHARIPLGTNDRETTRDKNGLSLPVTFRVSGISGVTTGLKLPVTIDKKTSGDYGIEFPQRNARQYFARVRRDLIPGQSLGRASTNSGFPILPGAAGSSSSTGLSPIRQIAVARPLPTPPDHILDYDSILSSSDAVERPARALNRNLFVEVAVSGNRDVSNKRQGPLLLSRLPEVQIGGSLPLIGKIPQDASDTALRRFLQSPHFQLTGNIMEGRYHEQRLQNDQKTVYGGRTGISAGIGMLPLLIGSHVLLRPQVTNNYFYYHTAGSPSYRFTESSMTLDYLFYGRTMIGGSYIRRDQSGGTPFTFDQVDTRNEGQLRVQIGLPGGKFTLASQIRYDLTQSHIFDTEVALSWRGKAIEPRFTYRTQNSQFGFGVTLPGLLP